MEEQRINFEVGKAYKINSVLYRITKIDKDGIWGFEAPEPTGILNAINDMNES